MNYFVTHHFTRFKTQFPKLREDSRKRKFTNNKDGISTAGRPRSTVFIQWTVRSVYQLLMIIRTAYARLKDQE